MGRGRLTPGEWQEWLVQRPGALKGDTVFRGCEMPDGGLAGGMSQEPGEVGEVKGKSWEHSSQTAESPPG